MPKKDYSERFWEKVDTRGVCWEWTSAVNPWGYPIFWHGGGMSKRAHRVAWELLIGPIPEGLVLDHLCRVRHCVNPDHLEPVTQQVNTLRGRLGATNTMRMHATTHCPHGHEWTPENTQFHTNGARRCRACRRLEYQREKAKASR